MNGEAMCSSINPNGSEQMKEVIERLFQRMPLSLTEEIDKMKKELFIAAEHGPEAVYNYFEKVAQTLDQKAEKLADQLKATIGVT